ncbi:MAG: hypothetical protein ACK56F_04060, partial [bacterium]
MRDGIYFGATCAKQRDDFVLANFLLQFDASQNFSDRTRNLFVFNLRADQNWRGIICTRIPLGRAVANQDNFGAIVHNIGRCHFFWPNLARVVSTETFGVAAVENFEVQRVVKPFRWRIGELWINRQTRRKSLFAFFCCVTKFFKRRPWPLGVH